MYEAIEIVLMDEATKLAHVCNERKKGRVSRMNLARKMVYTVSHFMLKTK